MQTRFLGSLVSFVAIACVASLQGCSESQSNGADVIDAASSADSGQPADAAIEQGVPSDATIETDAPVDAPADVTADGTIAPEASADAPSEDADVDAATTDAAEAGPQLSLTCFDEPPAGAPDPLPWPVYSGTCPTLAPAPAYNTIVSSGGAREFIAVVPDGLKPTERVPVVFVWHWLWGSAEDAVNELQLQQAANLHRFVAIAPKAKGDHALQWPFTILDSQSRLEEEHALFDDILGCVAATFQQATRHCVATVGVSAGALYSAELVASRANRISSFVSVSGGVGSLSRPWGEPARKLPGLVLWGGPTDEYANYDFNKASLELEDDLTSGGHFFLECVHNCGHDVPPLEAPAGGTKFDAFWRFIIDHPFWMGAGQSRWPSDGMPAGVPTWCGFGKGGAVPRPDGSGC